MALPSKPSSVSVSANQYGFFLILLAVPCVMAVYLNGTRSLFLILICAAVTFFSRIAGDTVFKKNADIRDLSALVTGISLALMLPSGISYVAAVIGCLFAVFTVMVPFGASHRSPFVPAAAGFAFLTICFPNDIFDYSAMAADHSDKFLESTSLAALLASGQAIHLNTASFLDIFTGNMAGPMGTTCVAVLLGCLICLAIVKPKNATVSVGFILAAGLLAFAFPRGNASHLSSLYLELSSGSLLFAGVFLASDPATIPGNNLYRFIYGLFCGAIAMAMRFFGTFEEGVCFAILLANAGWPILRSFLDSPARRRATKKGKEAKA